MGAKLHSSLSETERAMLMGGGCAKAYGWSPKKLVENFKPGSMEKWALG